MQCCNCDELINEADATAGASSANAGGANANVSAVECEGGCGGVACPSCKDYVFSIYCGDEDEDRENGIDIWGVPICDDCINKNRDMIEESIEELSQWCANAIRGSLLSRQGPSFHEQLGPHITNMIQGLRTRAKETNLDLDDKIEDFEIWLDWFFE